MKEKTMHCNGPFADHISPYHLDAFWTVRAVCRVDSNFMINDMSSEARTGWTKWFSTIEASIAANENWSIQYYSPSHERSFWDALRYSTTKMGCATSALSGRYLPKQWSGFTNRCPNAESLLRYPKHQWPFKALRLITNLIFYCGIYTPLFWVIHATIL